MKIIFLLSCCFIFNQVNAQQDTFYKKKFFELLKEERPIQKLKYNQNKASTLTQKGDILLVEKLDYFETSKGFKLYKFKPEGTIDSTFGQAGIAEQLFPEAYYDGDDIIEAPNGDIFVAGVVRERKMGVGAKTIVVKYFANGTVDRNFGAHSLQESCFLDDFEAFFDIDGQRIILTKDQSILLLTKTVDGNYEYKMTLVELTYEGYRNGLSGYYDSKLSYLKAYITNLQGTFDYSNFKQLSGGRVAVVGAYAKSLKEHKKQLGFAAVYKKNLRIDSTFATNGLFLSHIDSLKLQTIDDIVELPTGKLMLLGSIYKDKKEDEKESKLFLMRLDANGNIDNSFGENGIVFFEEAGINDFGQKIELLNDGNLLVAIHSNGKSREFLHKFFLVFDENGKLIKPKGIDLFWYQHYVNCNFPYTSFFQKIIRDYGKK